jgi:transcription elongation factor Elf1
MRLWGPSSKTIRYCPRCRDDVITIGDISEDERSINVSCSICFYLIKTEERPKATKITSFKVNEFSLTVNGLEVGGVVESEENTVVVSGIVWSQHPHDPNLLVIDGETFVTRDEAQKALDNYRKMMESRYGNSDGS